MWQESVTNTPEHPAHAHPAGVQDSTRNLKPSTSTAVGYAATSRSATNCRLATSAAASRATDDSATWFHGCRTARAASTISIEPGPLLTTGITWLGTRRVVDPVVVVGFATTAATSSTAAIVSDAEDLTEAAQTEAASDFAPVFTWHCWTV